MQIVFHYVVIPVLFLALGYWIGTDPNDARAVAQKLRDAVERLFKRKEAQQ